MKVEFILETGFAGATHREIVEFDDSYSEEDIDDCFQEWKNSFLDASWHMLENEDED